MLRKTSRVNLCSSVPRVGAPKGVFPEGNLFSYLEMCPCAWAVTAAVPWKGDVTGVIDTESNAQYGLCERSKCFTIRLVSVVLSEPLV